MAGDPTTATGDHGRVDRFPGLPVDPDSEPAPPGRPIHLRWVPVGIVAGGGALGALARYLLALLWPTPPDGWPWATFVTNLSGAFLLGLLLEALVSSGQETPRTRAVRLFAGTGFVGAFTTYSTLAVEADLLIRDGHSLAGVSYVLASALSGFVAALIGVVVAGRAGWWSGPSARPPKDIPAPGRRR